MNAVLAFGQWRNNAEMIVDVARLGYLRSEWTTLDCTWGRGSFWNAWRPDALIRSDRRQLDGVDLVADFTRLPFADRAFDVVVFDPPYKLNGTPDTSNDVDERYGVHEPVRWQDRHELIRRGIVECLRVAREFLLLKCQDQVSSGAVRWQTREFSDHAERNGARLVDRFDLPSYRAQPSGRRQVHARRNHSTLLVFSKGE